MPKLRPTQEKPEAPNPDAAAAADEQAVNGAVVDEAAQASQVEDAAQQEEPEASEAEDASLVLQKQIDALKKSEEIQRNRADQATRDREEALRRASEREVEISKFRQEAQESQYDSIVSALSAAKAEVDSAKKDIRKAIADGDIDLQTEAYERMSIAAANISKLEDGKYELESRAKAAKTAQPQVERTPAQKDSLDNTNLPPVAKQWLRDHPEYISDPRKNSKLQSLHWDVVDEGLPEFSTAYFESIERRLGLREKPAAAPQQKAQQQEQQGASIVSAPVSRNIPNGTPNRSNGKITLTKDQAEAAKISGVSAEEYAKQLMKIEEMTRNGTYGGRQ